jgi:hypothetical protein
MNVGQLCGHSCFKICGHGGERDAMSENKPANLDQRQVELIDVRFLSTHSCFVRSNLDHDANDKVSDTWIGLI